MSNAEFRRIENDYRATQVNATNFNDVVGEISTLQSRSKYEINLIRFPAELGTDPSMQHYVTFAINVRGKSKFNGDRLFEVIKNPNGAQLTTEELSNSTKTLAKAAGAVVGASIGNMVAKKVVDAVPRTGSNNISRNAGAGAVDTVVTAAGAAAGAAAGYAVGSAVGDILSFSQMLKPDTSYRISDVITLHMEEKPSVKYSAEYANKDLGTLAGVLAQSGGKDLVDTVKNLGNMSGELAAAAALGLAKLPSIFGATDVKSILSASGKVALNPFREVLFEAIDFRTFNFKYRLMPRSAAEADSVKNIIRLFKFHMHPELSTNRLFFIYPGEFQITYYFKNKENNYFHKFRPCVLTDLQIDYGGEQFSSFKDGKPNEINLQLTFRETELLTKELITQGY